MKFRYRGLHSWKYYFWFYIAIASVNLYIYFFVNVYLQAFCIFVNLLLIIRICSRVILRPFFEAC